MSRRRSRAGRLAKRAFERSAFKRGTDVEAPVYGPALAGFVRCECGELVTDGRRTVHIPKNSTLPCPHSWPATKPEKTTP